MTNEYEYWTDEVEEAVGKFTTCVDIKEKNLIFTKYLHTAFKKLIDDVVQKYRPDWDGHNEQEIKDDLLYTLVINVRRFNPDRLLPSGKKPTARTYCKVIIMSAIADQRVKSYKKKKIFND